MHDVCTISLGEFIDCHLQATLAGRSAEKFAAVRRGKQKLESIH